MGSVAPLRRIDTKGSVRRILYHRPDNALTAHFADTPILVVHDVQISCPIESDFSQMAQIGLSRRNAILSIRIVAAARDGSNNAFRVDLANAVGVGDIQAACRIQS